MPHPHVPVFYFLCFSIHVSYGMAQLEKNLDLECCLIEYTHLTKRYIVQIYN